MGGLIAVNGSTGQLGGRIARCISESGERQRLLVRDPARAPRLPGAQAEVVDLTSAAGTRHQLAGVDTFVFVPYLSRNTGRVSRFRSSKQRPRRGCSGSSM